MPFSRKLTPAALPVFTTISRLARTEEWAGAIKVSAATGLPSAMMETHAVLSARISRVTVGGGFAAAEAAVGAAGREEAGGAASGGVVEARVAAAAGMAAADGFAADRVAEDDAFPVEGETAELDGVITVGTGAENGTAVEVGD